MTYHYIENYGRYVKPIIKLERSINKLDISDKQKKCLLSLLDDVVYCTINATQEREINIAKYPKGWDFEDL